MSVDESWVEGGSGTTFMPRRLSVANPLLAADDCFEVVPLPSFSCDCRDVSPPSDLCGGMFLDSDVFVLTSEVLIALSRVSRGLVTAESRMIG